MSMAAIGPGGPAVGLPRGVFLAPLGRRTAAFAIDALVPYVLIIVGSVILAAGGPGWLAVILYLLPLVWAIVLWWMYATRAAGPGMRLMHLQVVGMRDGRPIGWWRALLRALVLTLCCGVLVLGIVLVVLMLRQIRRQGWHDLAADSVVIEERQLAPKAPAGAPAEAMISPPAAEPEPAAADQTPEPDSEPDVAAAEPDRDAAEAARRARHASTAGETSTPPDEPLQQTPAETGAAWYAALDDGRELPITGLILLGRNPAPRPGEEKAELIKIVDEARTVSKTHLSLDVDGAGVVVADRGSTNGSAITDPNGVYQLLSAGQPVRVAADGYLVSFGSHHLRLNRR